MSDRTPLGETKVTGVSEADRKEQEEYAEYLQYLEYLRAQGQPDYSEQEMPTPAVKGIKRAADYLGGAVGALGAEAMGLGAKGELLKAFDPRTPPEEVPGAKEYMRRAGVSPEASLSKLPGVGRAFGTQGESPWWRPEQEGPLDLTAYGAGATAIDIAKDPLTWVGMGPFTSAASKALARESIQQMGARMLKRTLPEKASSLATGLVGSPINLATSPLSQLAEYGGAKLFKSGVKRLDRPSVQAGSAPISDLLLKENIPGGYGSIARALHSKADAAEAAAKKIAQEVDAAAPVQKGVYGTPHGGWIDMSKAMRQAEKRVAKELADEPTLAALKERMEDLIAAHKGLGRVSLTKGLRLKSNLYKTIPDEAWGARESFNRVRKAMAQGLKNETEAAAKAAGRPDLAKQNKRWSEMLNVLDEADALAGAEELQPLITKTTALGMGMAGGLGGPRAAGGLGLTRTLYDLWQATPVRTTVGLGLHRLGKSRLSKAADAYFRQRGIIQRPGDQED